MVTMKNRIIVEVRADITNYRILGLWILGNCKKTGEEKTRRQEL